MCVFLHPPKCPIESFAIQPAEWTFMDASPHWQSVTWNQCPELNKNRLPVQVPTDLLQMENGKGANSKVSFHNRPVLVCGTTYFHKTTKRYGNLCRHLQLQMVQKHMEKKLEPTVHLLSPQTHVLPFWTFPTRHPMFFPSSGSISGGWDETDCPMAEHHKSVDIVKCFAEKEAN